jgi:hypothetical protein
MEAYDREDGQERFVCSDIGQLEEGITREEGAFLCYVDGKCNLDVMCLF